MERAFDTGSGGLVIALFQERAHFDVEAERYAALVARGTLVIVGFAGQTDGLPEGVHAVQLGSADPLRVEWAMVLLAGQLGTALVATDLRRLAVGERSLQASRLFQAQWSFRRRVAAGEATRLLDALGDRLPPDAVARGRAHIAASVAVPESTVEVQLAAAAEHLVTSLDAGARRSARLQAEVDTNLLLAEHDQLTGLHNRFYLERFLDGDPAGGTAVLLVDVDGLKAVNDDLGHLAGDAALATVARALRACSRPGDVLVRWGGDEFLLLLPGADAVTALDVAERLTRAVADAGLPAPWAHRGLSVSVGVCGDSAQRLPMEALDAALHVAKRDGKGRVQLASGVGGPT